MSTLNEILETFQNRLKSPIVGSIIISFLGWNWKAVLVVIFETNLSMVQRFEYFDKYTSFSDYLGPIALGMGFALLLPFINYGAAKIVQEPIQKQRLLGVQAAAESLK